MRYLSIVALLGVCIISTGCRSFSSVLLDRNEANTEWQSMRCLNGVPITLKVPTHLKLEVIETSYLIRSADGTYEHVLPPTPLRSVKHQFIESDKVFVVDLKRPASGQLQAEIDFDPQAQYFRKIDRDYTDETIENVTQLLGAIAQEGLFGVSTSANPKSSRNEDGALQIERTLTSTVATEVFEVNSPGFEIEMTEFLNRHLNGCHDCATSLAPIKSDSHAPDPQGTR